MTDALTLRYVPLKQVVVWDRNPKRHQIDVLISSIQRYGFKDAPKFEPTLNGGQGGIVAGNGRILALRTMKERGMPVPRGILVDESGEWTVPVLFGVDASSQAAAEAYGLDNNNLVMVGSGFSAEELMKLWTPEATVLLKDLAQSGNEPVSFKPEELADLIAPPELGESDEAEPGDERIPDSVILEQLQAKWNVQSGDLWQLGPHLLLCGDSTRPEMVQRLMGDEVAALCFTSPPYAQQRKYTTNGISDWDALMQGVFGQVPMAANGQVLVNLGLVYENELLEYWSDWVKWMKGQGWKQFGLYVWDCLHPIPGVFGGRFAPCFEFVFHFNRERREPNKIVECKYAGKRMHEPGEAAHGTPDANGKNRAWTAIDAPVQDYRIPESVIRIARFSPNGENKAAGLHPAPFPIALPHFIVRAFTDKGEIVYEPFSGSGQTLLACEQTGRKARCIELAPQYVALTLERYKEATGVSPVRM